MMWCSILMMWCDEIDDEIDDIGCFGDCSLCGAMKEVKKDG